MKTNIYAFILLLSLAAASSAEAAWGDYDTTFGFLGAALDGSVANHHPLGVAIQEDGKILVTGYRMVSGKKRFFLRRYLSNGQVDTSFGNNGSAISNPFIAVDADYAGHRILIQSNGRIVVAGVGNQDYTIWRFFSSGSADTSMGNGGMRTLSTYASTNMPPAIATYSNILYVGLKKTDNSEVVIKYNSDGTRDMSFGSGGEALTDGSYGFSLGVDPTTGNLLIGGRRGSDPSDFGIQRLLPSGVPDPTFNHWNAAYGGDPQGQPNGFVLLSNGQFVMNERWHNLGQGAILFGANRVRLSSTGVYTSRTVYQPTEFYNFGDPATTGSCPDITAVQADGRVIMTPANMKRLYRFNTSFTTINSMTCSNYSSLSSRTNGALQSDDKMVAAGTYNGNIALVRTLP